jgi:hypothetical protein
MPGEITVRQGELGIVTVDYGDGIRQDYPSMYEAMQAAHQEAMKDGTTVRVIRS